MKKKVLKQFISKISEKLGIDSAVFWLFFDSRLGNVRRAMVAIYLYERAAGGDDTFTFARLY